MMPWYMASPAARHGQERPLSTVTEPHLWHACGTTQGHVPAPTPVPSSWPPCSSRWWCQWWRLRYRGATPSGAIDFGEATWMIFGRGSSDPEPKDSRTDVVVVRG